MNQRKRGTSNAPIVLGIVGGVLGFPAAYCSGLCAATTESLLSETSGELTSFYTYSTLLLSIFIIVISCFSKKSPMAVGILMLISSLILVGLYVVTLNLIGIISVVICVIGGILSIVQKKEDVDLPQNPQ